MQLTKQLDHFVLGRRIFAKVFVGDFPKFGDAAFAVHQGNDQPR